MNIDEIKDSLEKNSPNILTGLAILGVISIVGLVVKATPKALKDLEAAKEFHGRKLTRREVIKATWKNYIPAAAVSVTTVGCIIGTNSIHLKRNAALGALYTITEKKAKDYQSKIIETFGEGKELKVRDAIAKDKVSDFKDKEIINTGKGNTICYDSMSGRVFQCDVESLRQIRNDLNYELQSSMYVSLNELYYAIGLKPIKLGDDLGWNSDTPIEFSFSTQLTENGEPCLVLDYNIGPRWGYNKLG